MGYIKTVDEFHEYQNILEKLNNDLFDIPGFHKVSVHLKGDDFELQTSNSDIFWISFDKIRKYALICKDNPGITSFAVRMFQESILSRNDSELLSKIKTIVKASTLEIFNIEDGTLLNNIYDELIYLGASKEDASSISSSLQRMYVENEEDKFSPEGKAIFTEYLNVKLEIVGSIIYLILEYLDKTNLVILPPPLGNIDKVLEDNNEDETNLEINEEEAIKTSPINIELGQSVYKTYADYQKDLEMIWKIVDKAINLAGQKPGVMIDYYTNRKPNATSIYVSTPVKDTNLNVVAILNPVEQKKIFGYNDVFVFSVETEDGMIENSYMELKNEVEISNAIKELL